MEGCVRSLGASVLTCADRFVAVQWSVQVGKADFEKNEVSVFPRK